MAGSRLVPAEGFWYSTFLEQSPICALVDSLRNHPNLTVTILSALLSILLYLLLSIIIIWIFQITKNINIHLSLIKTRLRWKWGETQVIHHWELADDRSITPHSSRIALSAISVTWNQPEEESFIFIIAFRNCLTFFLFSDTMKMSCCWCINVVSGGGYDMTLFSLITVFVGWPLPSALYYLLSLLMEWRANKTGLIGLQLEAHEWKRINGFSLVVRLSQSGGCI